MANIRPALINASGEISQAQTGDVVPVSYGGTGLAALTANSYLRAVSSSAFELRTPAQVLSDIGALSTTGTAASATVLATARTINGTSFNGSANITTSLWGTARTLTIGATGKSVNGSANVAWTLAEIGAAATVHTHVATDITDLQAQLSGRVERNSLQLNADGTAPDGFFSANTDTLTLKYSNNTTGSTGYPTEFGATLSVIMDKQSSRSFDLHMTTGSANFLYFRGYSSTATPTEWKTLAALQNAGSWTALQSFNAGWRLPNNQQGLMGSGGGGIRGTDTGSVVVTSGTGGNGFVYIRPNGDTISTAQSVFYANGTVDMPIVRAGASSPSADGAVMLEFVSDRPWQVRQYGAGSTAQLEFYDTTGAKTAVFTNASNANLIVLNPTNSSVSANTFIGALTGNATTATTLATARTINGTSFNGSANITTSLWGTARNLTIGSTSKSVNGSANVAWSLAEIGAASVGDVTTIQTGIGGDNQVGNGNFYTGTAAGWTGGNAGIGSATVSRTIVDSTLASAGKAYRMDIANLPTTGYFEVVSNTAVKIVRVQGGEFATLSSYVRGTAGARVFLQIRWNDATGAAISYTGTPGGAPYVTSETWTKISQSAQAPAAAVSANVYVRVYGTAAADQWFECSHISLQVGSIGTGYAPSIEELRNDFNNLITTPNVWEQLQTFNAGWTLKNDTNGQVGTGGAAIWGSSNGSLVLASGATAGNFIYLRPNGPSSTAAQSTIDTNGLLTIPAITTPAFTMTGTIMTLATNSRIQFGSTASSTLRDAGTAGIVISTAVGTLFLRAGGDTSVTNQVALSTASFTVGGNTIWHAGNLAVGNIGYLDTANTWAQTQTLSGGLVVPNPNSPLSNAALQWNNDTIRIRIGGTGSTPNAPFMIQGTSDFVRMNLDSGGNVTFGGTVTATGFGGNATTATTLATARTINGTSFNGSANITTTNWGTARTITIGSTGKSVNGSANVSWTLAEIGVSTSDFVTMSTAQTITGAKTVNADFHGRLISYFGGGADNTGNKIRFTNSGTTIRIDAVNSAASTIVPMTFNASGFAFTGGQPLTVDNHIQLRANGRNLQIFDNNNDTVAVDIGAGIASNTDRGGYVINRNASGELSLWGRNGSVQLRLGIRDGAAGNFAQFNVPVLFTAPSMDPGNVTTWALMSAGGNGGGHGMRDNSGSGNYYGGMYLGNGQMYLGVGLPNTTGIAANIILKSDGQLYLTGNQLNVEGTSPTIRFWDSDNGNTSWIHANDGNHGFLAHNNYTWACFRNSGNDWQCQNNIIAYASDARLKKNIVDAPNNIIEHFFENVRIRQFDWDEEQIARYKVGIKARVGEVGAVAQEMQAIYADAVAVNEAHNPIKTKDNPNPVKPNFLTIDWTKTVPLLIAEIQNLRRRVKQLENRS